jgi:hypothetical protein
MNTYKIKTTQLKQTVYNQYVTLDYPPTPKPLLGKDKQALGFKPKPYSTLPTDLIPPEPSFQLIHASKSPPMHQKVLVGCHQCLAAQRLSQGLDNWSAM